MLKTVEGTYHNGELTLDEPVPGISEARVLVTFLPQRGQAETRRSYRSFCGSISKEDAEEMIRVIEEDCERIDPGTW